ncbi:hypothetical protein F0562_025670 [Nyssa sinensis]|uniref:Disease resistance N-terminal domain-containing protein n=1 Tax=Nyssa sinensis TaxID=561372 RepID=A0A5J5B8R7_9ASTE|nr:hypothetical protein F0562_025670 [Nyssa sinensis]
MAIGEIFLSAFITVLFDKLLYPELINLARREGLHPAIHKLEKTLRDIEAFLNDAESKQMTDKAIKLWLEELQDLAYVADDVLDEFATEALRLKLLAEPQSSTTRSKVRCLIPSCCASFGPTALAFNLEIESKIKEINSQLDDIATRRINEEIDPFPHLIKLSISDCPKLLGKLPSHLPSLKELLIEKCPQLEVALPSLGMLHETRNSVDFSSLTNLSITNVPIPAFLCNTDVAADELVLAHATSNQLKSLTRLNVKGIPNLTSFPLWFIQGLTGLEELEIVDCGELASLWVWPNKVQLQHQLPALRHLVIRSCPQLFCLLEENDKEEEGKHEELPCMRMLEYLEIRYCEILEKLPRDLHTLEFLQDLKITNCPRLISLPSTQRKLEISGHLIEGLMHNNSLEELHVDGCPSLTSLSFPKTGTLRRLHIRECRALESLTEVLMHNNNIKELVVNRCESLMSLSSGCGLPPMIKFLCIYNCAKLESIVDEGLKINSSLECVRIENCKNLKSLPDGPRDLSELGISDCDNLESLPEGWLSSTSLRHLMIHNCRKLEALPNRGNFPTTTSLNSLSIPYSSELGLHRLSCLKGLYIKGRSLSQDLVSFPERGMPLPTSLTELTISGFPNLESLSSEFQNLVSLESLSVDCCPKLTSFPDKGLPRSLLRLWITGCPLLQQRCERKRGQYWHMIVNIPMVSFDGSLQVLL